MSGKHHKKAGDWYCYPCKYPHPEAHTICGNCGKTKEVIAAASKAYKKTKEDAKKVRDDARKLKEDANEVE